MRRLKKAQMQGGAPKAGYPPQVGLFQPPVTHADHR
jgi:hypothetical protein